jgi:hypothetical protein
MTLDPQARTQLRAWWILWVSALPAIIIFQAVIPHKEVDPALKLGDVLLQLVGVVPLFLSIVIRWLALPRFTSLTPALPLFIVGLALAEACGFLGIFLGGPYRDALFLLSALGLVQFVPVFAKRLGEPKGSGFIPNN